MRFHVFAVAASALVLGACAGGDKAADNATTDTAAVTPAATTTPTPAAAGTAAPITGTTHEVKMIGDAQGYRFEPANITVKAGDGIKFITVTGGPHNVAFDAADPAVAAVKGQLDANISEKMGELSSAMKMNANESITVSFAKIAPGNYPYHCVPHLAMGMKGVITVQ